MTKEIVEDEPARVGYFSDGMVSISKDNVYSAMDNDFVVIPVSVLRTAMQLVEEFEASEKSEQNASSESKDNVVPLTRIDRSKDK